MRIAFRLSGIFALACSLFIAGPVQADVNPREQLKQHVRDIVKTVKDAPTAAKKRAILDEKLRAMVTVLDRAKQMTKRSAHEKNIEALRARLQEKLDELHGQNGYTAVPDGQLNTFADYVQQDFEQADQFITISATTAVLILILLILLL